MKSRFLLASLIAAPAIFGTIAPSAAANLTVMPTSLRIAPPKAADVITIRNEGRAPVKMQIRIFRWEQRNGKDVYLPADGVIASPPFVTIKGGSDGNIRVARIAKTPVQGVESYRLIVDELPSSRVRAKISGQAASVEVVTRQILPIFFVSTPNARTSAGGASAAAGMSFTAQEAKGGYYITVRNGSSNVIRVGEAVLLAGGQEIGRSRQAAGNVLPRRAIKFFVPGKGGGRPQQIRLMNGNTVEGTYPVN